MLLLPCSCVLLRATAECLARLRYGVGICLSVRLSVCHTLQFYQMVQSRITISLPCAAPIVFYVENLCPWMRDFPSNEDVKEGSRVT